MSLTDAYFVKQAVTSLQEDLAALARIDKRQAASEDGTHDAEYLHGRSEGYSMAADWLKRHVLNTPHFKRLTALDTPPAVPTTDLATVAELAEVGLLLEPVGWEQPC